MSDTTPSPTEPKSVSHSETVPQSQTELGLTLPIEILSLVVASVDARKNPTTLAVLMQVNKEVSEMAAPRLYRELKFDSDDMFHRIVEGTMVNWRDGATPAYIPELDPARTAREAARLSTYKADDKTQARKLDLLRRAQVIHVTGLDMLEWMTKRLRKIFPWATDIHYYRPDATIPQGSFHINNPGSSGDYIGCIENPIQLPGAASANHLKEGEYLAVRHAKYEGGGDCFEQPVG